MLPGRRRLTGVLPVLLAPLLATATALGVLAASPVSAADPAPTVLTLTAEPRYAGALAPLLVSLTAEDGTPVAGASVAVERRVDGTWLEPVLVTTDESGQATPTFRVARERADNLFRATYDGDGVTYAGSSGRLEWPILKRTSRVRLTAPPTVVDETSLRLRLAWATGNGTAVRGPVKLFARPAGGEWRLLRRLRTDGDGLAALLTRPRLDTAYRAVALGTDWARRASSEVVRVDNLPPVAPVRLPAAAPRPRRSLPAQARAVGEGPNLVVTGIPDGVWRSMVGRSWHRGCPVGRAGLRLVRVNYWGFDGYRHRGELVAAVGAAGQMGAALAEMYRRALPIRAMYRVDRFGWSRRLQGGDDYASMAADNTSAFNCRHVVGRPGVRSPHSYGRSLDINPWENPYRASHGWTPNSWWVGRSHDRVAWRSRNHPVVAVMARHGLRWTYGTSDAHHFDARGHGRAVARGPVADPSRVHPQCGDDVCK